MTYVFILTITNAVLLTLHLRWNHAALSAMHAAAVTAGVFTFLMGVQC